MNQILNEISNGYLNSHHAFRFNKQKKLSQTKQLCNKYDIETKSDKKN
jgi:hypothetical protein